ncbi:MAG: amino acid permease, partial [Candidatus Thioglobus sp.]
AAVILATLILGSLTIAMIIPAGQLNLATGVVQSFAILFNKLGCPALTNWMILFIFIGSIGGLSTWMAGPSRNMMIAAKDGVAPKFISKSNRFGAAHNMLLLQAVIFTLLCGAFLLFKNFNSAYGLLSEMTGEISMLVYILLFTAAIRLRYSRANLTRPFQLAGGNASLWLVAGIATITCLCVFIIGFVPPAALQIKQTGLYESMLISVIALSVCSGLWITTRAKK